MDHTTLANLITQIQSVLKTDFALIEHHTKAMNLRDVYHHLDWNLAHMRVSMLDYIRDLERHKKYLEEDINATQPIQDQLR